MDTEEVDIVHEDHQSGEDEADLFGNISIIAHRRRDPNIDQTFNDFQLSNNFDDQNSIAEDDVTSDDSKFSNAEVPQTLKDLDRSIEAETNAKVVREMEMEVSMNFEDHKDEAKKKGDVDELIHEPRRWMGKRKLRFYFWGINNFV